MAPTGVAPPTYLGTYYGQRVYSQLGLSPYAQLSGFNYGWAIPGQYVRPAITVMRYRCQYCKRDIPSERLLQFYDKGCQGCGSRLYEVTSKQE